MVPFSSENCAQITKIRQKIHKKAYKLFKNLSKIHSGHFRVDFCHFERREESVETDIRQIPRLRTSSSAGRDSRAVP